MSTDVDGFVDNFAEGVSSGPQRLPAMSLTECSRCHARVYFRARSSTPSADPHFKIEYLFCPVCGASATQVREVEVLPKATARRKAVRYRYKAC